jgi:hypothetical protein
MKGLDVLFEKKMNEVKEVWWSLEAGDKNKGIDKERMEKWGNMDGMEWDGGEQNLWNRTCCSVNVGASERKLAKFLLEILAGRWRSHGIGPYGPCIIFGYKTERRPSVFFSELHYHYHHYCFLNLCLLLYLLLRSARRCYWMLSGNGIR